jgi:hypothetical protein
LQLINSKSNTCSLPDEDYANGSNQVKQAFEFDEENYADREDGCSNPAQDEYGDDR